MNTTSLAEPGVPDTTSTCRYIVIFPHVSHYLYFFRILSRCENTTDTHPYLCIATPRRKPISVYVSHIGFKTRTTAYVLNMKIISIKCSGIVANAGKPPLRRTQQNPAGANDPRSAPRRPPLRSQSRKPSLDRGEYSRSTIDSRARREGLQTPPRNPRGKSASKVQTETSDLQLPRSVLMDKQVVTRTSGKRLGYIDDIFVDPVSLEVKTLYLRQNISSLSIGSSSREHVSLSSLRQIGDVVLVHDESALWDPPGDESLGFVKMVGSEVQTEDGLTLGRVRDFLFNPDSGQISSIRYDALGLPSIPQELLGCSRLDERDIVAIGPSRTIVRRGSEKRAVKENDGWVAEYVTSFINLIAGMDIEDLDTSTKGENYRADPAYAAWYKIHAKDYEMYYNQKLPEPIVMEGSKANSIQKRREQNKTLALPPPQRRSVDQAFREGSVPSTTRRVDSKRKLVQNRRPQQQQRMTIDQQSKEQIR